MQVTLCVCSRVREFLCTFHYRARLHYLCLHDQWSLKLLPEGPGGLGFISVSPKINCSNQLTPSV